MLQDRDWKLKYTPNDGDLVRLFYVPALEDAERYDRLTGYFSAGALALAARGIEGLVRNRGRMRLIVGCTLPPPEIEAIERGAELRALVEQRLAELPLAPPDAEASGALELLAWMVARGHLEVKVAVPCDADGKPVSDGSLFHEKTGIIEDRTGERIAWTGSLNETAAGWRANWESINVFTSWGPEPGRVASEEASFARIWANRIPRWSVFDFPDAVRRDLLRFLPADDALPTRLRKGEGQNGEPPEKAKPAPEAPIAPPVDRRARVWAFIQRAPALPGGGECVGEATAAVTPWPHQVRAFERLYRNWPPKLLIADEVGLGKTIQAGMLLRQAWLARRAQRVLILAPKAVLGQWQLELREKFNLNWPIYDGRRLVRYPSPAWRGRHQREVGRSDWHEEPAVIASSQLMRRRDRAEALLAEAQPWDLVVLDEAHHARRRGAGGEREGGPNALLGLMRRLKERTQGLVLLTATPMQVHPVEVWDLLALLGLPPEWSAEAFLRFFDDIEQPNPSPEAMERMARLFQAVERGYGPVATEDAQKRAELSRLKAGKVLRALRDVSSIPRRQLETPERQAAVRIARAHTPIPRLVSRHTRELLRRYFKAGLLTTAIADRRVEDRFVEMSAGERSLYEAVEDYVSATWQQAGATERSAVGFVMTVYRRRLASSFRALGATLERHLNAVTADPAATTLDEDAPDDELDEALDTDEMAAMERQVLAAQETGAIQGLLDDIGRLPPDSKVAALGQALEALSGDGYRQVMVFTQYTDTMDFLREQLGRDTNLRLLCFSGRGGEFARPDGVWSTIGRDDAKRRFRDGEADLLLCTDAAAEGLNFQFCGALVNYDMPWNPMRVEQRIGRIDRLGQRHPVIRIINLHYDDTVETDVYRALRKRIGLFETVVGRLQPILARLPRAISDAVLSGRKQERADVVETIEQETSDAERRGFDLDAALADDIAMPERPRSPMVMEDLDRVIAAPALMPPGVDVQPMRHREYSFLAPGMPEPLRVTTNPSYYEQHAESVELWSPGNPLFQPPEFVAPDEDDAPEARSLKDILDGAE